MNTLPKQYEWLGKEPAPRMLLEALKLYGVEEKKGPENNPEILKWAKELSIDKTYLNDETPWCGLFAAVVTHRAGKPVVKSPLWARNWLNFGNKCEPELGCIMVFSRGDTSGHVGIYICEDDKYYYVCGGNQKDKVCIVPVERERLLGARNLYTVKKPDNVRKILLSAGGEVSTNEA